MADCSHKVIAVGKSSQGLTDIGIIEGFIRCPFLTVVIAYFASCWFGVILELHAVVLPSVGEGCLEGWVDDISSIVHRFWHFFQLGCSPDKPLVVDAISAAKSDGQRSMLVSMSCDDILIKTLRKAI